MTTDPTDVSLVDAAIDALRRGEFVVVDDGDTGVLAVSAQKMTPEKMAFLVRSTSGVVSIAMEPDRVDELCLPESVGADRYETVRALVSPATRPGDLSGPGHVVPVRYRPGGVLVRAGAAEAVVDLVRLAGAAPAGVFAEIVDDTGGARRAGALVHFATERGLALVAVADVIRYRARRERLVRRVAQARVPTEHGVFTAMVYESLLDATEHAVLVLGDVTGTQPVLVRIHSECLTGDVFGSTRCDCGQQLHLALATVADAGAGVVVYLRGHEGRGIGLAQKLRAYALQDAGRDTVEANLELGLPADAREYGIGAQILADLGVTTVRLMTNNPAKYRGIEGYGLTVAERVPLHTVPNDENIAYLRAKQRKLGHLLGIDA